MSIHFQKMIVVIIYTNINIVGIVRRIERICSLKCTRRECIIEDVQIITAWKTAAYLLLFFLWQTFKNIINIRVHSEWWGKYNIWSLMMSCNSMKYEQFLNTGNFILPYERQQNNFLGLCLLTQFISKLAMYEEWLTYLEHWISEFSILGRRTGPKAAYTQ